MEIYFTIRHMVTLIIMCSGEARDLMSPSYVLEKIKDLQRTNVPEQFLDDINMQKFRNYASVFGMDWNSQRDYSDLPAERRCFDEITGTAKPEFIPVGSE